MAKKAKSAQALMAREAAALAAEGMDTTHIWMRLDLSASEVEELYAHPEFEASMRKHGDDLWEAWALSRSEDKSRLSAHQFILSRTDKYLERLDTIAMDVETKDETAARILLSFLESTKQLGQDAAMDTRRSLSPATIKLINKGEDIYRRHPPPLVDPDVPDNGA